MAPVRGFLLLVAVVGIGWLGHGCGRTSLDDGFGGGGPTTGLGSASGLGGGSGVGGNRGGVGGANAPNPCGGTSCQSGTQTCCTRVVMGQTTQTCIPTGTTCNGGITTACLSSANCAPGQSCCATLPTLATSCQSAAQCLQSGQFILCASNDGCPAPTPRCCLQAPGLGLCLPAGAACF